MTEFKAGLAAEPSRIQARAKLARQQVKSERPGPPGRGVRVLRRAYGFLRQGVASAKVSRGGPGARCRRCAGRRPGTAVVSLHGKPKPCDFKTGWVADAWK